jgi:t-SNARE complex subunit (syntaxin)
MLKCYNETTVSQLNLINDCNPAVSSQINNNNTVLNCMIKNGITMKSSAIGDTDNASKGGNDQKSTGLEWWGILLIVVGIFLVGLFFKWLLNRRSSTVAVVK